ncbi:Gfo/Idh/MocA family protein [Natrinema ejinorense]|uniref:Oxidoreductase n=1 Tax=Natrinema ejinorense TaxID=373386 RepID=A0A2A5QQ22_9EURY|nr:Gfo/Idh/MocA family oxidoreductase [Natrinema ejinorense]PCR88833.1 oxidoreductase [Natrinema ejinorense]
MCYQMAVLGTGGLGTMLGTQIRRQPDAALVALSDVSDESRRKAGETLDVPADARYETLAELLAEEALDALVIATPHTLHYEQLLATLDRDCHVLCEKPLVTDLEEARDLVHRADDTEQVVMVGYQRHVEPEYRYAKRRWEPDGSAPSFISAEIVEGWVDPNVGTWRMEPSLSGGGFIYDTGNHVVDAVLWTTGLTPATVRAEMDFEREGVDSRATVTIEFEGGQTAHLSFHADTPRVAERLQGWDERGGIRIEGREWGRRSITEIDEDGSESEPYIGERDSAYENPRSKLDAFVAAIEGDEPVPATPRDALRATAVTEAAYESARTDDPVDVDL